jgi:hypothetical protein
MGRYSVGGLFFFGERKLERKQKEMQASVYVPVW